MDQSHVKRKEVLPAPVKPFMKKKTHFMKKKNICRIKVDINYTNLSPYYVGSGPCSRLCFSLSLRLYQVYIIPSAPKGWPEEEEGKINLQGNSYYLCGTLSPGEGGKFYHTRQGWRKVDTDHKQQSLGSNLLWHLIHHLPCPIHFLCFRTVTLGLAKNGAPKEIRKQNHNAPNFVKITMNTSKAWKSSLWSSL